MTTLTTSTILIPAGTIVGYSFEGKPGTAPITGTVKLVADAIIDDATRDEDGSWRYGISPKRTYFCAGGLATVLPR